jgi:hypothetical protein
MKWHDVAKWVIITAFCVVGVWLLSGCSADAIRQGNNPPDVIPLSRAEQRNRIANEGKDFCERYPDDIACKGPKRSAVATDSHKYCLENPKDSACQGPNSK